MTLQPRKGWPADYELHAIRTPVMGFVELDPFETWLIDQPPFQRLRRIHQLAFSDYVFPGADHSRFLHTLSVLKMGTRVLERMERAATDDLGSEADWRKRRCLFRLAALFHDAGHPPFSHAAEELLPVGKTHEHFSIEILSQYGDLIEKEYADVKLTELTGLLDPDAPRCDPEHHVVLDLLNGEIDADKLSYLLDDAYFCGVEYGQYDSRRFVETSRAYRDERGEVHQALGWGGLHVAEEVIVARYKMLIQVYFHRTRRAYDHALADFLADLLPGGRLPEQLDDYLAWDDPRVLAEARQAIIDPNTDDRRRMLADRLVNRHHATAVFDPPTTKFDRVELEKYLGPIGALLTALETDGIESWEDNAEKLPHKLGENSGKTIVVLDEHGEPQSLWEKSPIVRALTDEIHLFRIYAMLGWQEQKRHYDDICRGRAAEDAKLRERLGGDSKAVPS